MLTFSSFKRSPLFALLKKGARIYLLFVFLVLLVLFLLRIDVAIFGQGYSGRDCFNEIDAIRSIISNFKPTTWIYNLPFIAKLGLGFSIFYYFYSKLKKLTKCTKTNKKYYAKKA